MIIYSIFSVYVSKEKASCLMPNNICLNIKTPVLLLVELVFQLCSQQEHYKVGTRLLPAQTISSF